jgi:Na+-transporting methylmalonyl-CoA/oxaloacetate decarboxylase gamma subunit
MKYSKANTDFASLSMFAMFMQEMGQIIVREALESRRTPE